MDKIKKILNLTRNDNKETFLELLTPSRLKMVCAIFICN